MPSEAVPNHTWQLVGFVPTTTPAPSRLLVTRHVIRSPRRPCSPGHAIMQEAAGLSSESGISETTDQMEGGQGQEEDNPLTYL